MCSVFPTCAEPWNITCSNRCAKPVLPLTSCFEPTLYQMFTAATGARWSSEMISRRPLGRRVCVKSTLGTGTGRCYRSGPRRVEDGTNPRTCRPSVRCGAARASGHREQRSVQRDLVERAQRGDRAAFAELAAASIGRLYNMANLMLRDRFLAEDAVQEALATAWRDVRGLRDLDAFDAWLHRVLVRCVYREAARERRHAIQIPAMSRAEESPDAAGAIADRDAIDRAFRRIQPQHRAVLVLRFYLDM